MLFCYPYMQADDGASAPLESTPITTEPLSAQGGECDARRCLCADACMCQNCGPAAVYNAGTHEGLDLAAYDFTVFTDENHPGFEHSWVIGDWIFGVEWDGETMHVWAERRTPDVTGTVYPHARFHAL